MSDTENEIITVLKKPKSAYIYFCTDKRQEEEIKKLQPKEILKKLGELWQEVKKKNDVEYKKYNQLAEEAKKIYNEQKEKNSNVVVPSKKKKDSVKKEKKNEEEKPPRKLNGYLKYLQANRTGCKENNPSFSSKQVTKLLAEEWGKLNDDDKKKWKEKN
jgi:hypothetical protein